MNNVELEKRIEELEKRIGNIEQHIINLQNDVEVVRVAAMAMNSILKELVQEKE